MLNSTKSIFQVVLNQRVSKFSIFLICILSQVSGCKSLQFRTTKKEILTDFGSKKFERQHTGFLVVDTKKSDTLFDINGDKFFTPASTTKLFTLYTSLQLLGEKMPLLKFAKKDDATHILPTGDPTWLHPRFLDSTAVSFLKKQDSIILYLQNYEGDKYRPGWAWEDYPYYFSPELTAVPLFGNVVTINSSRSIKVDPQYFATSVKRKNGMPLRERYQNQFYISEESQDTLQVPYMTTDSLTLKLLWKSVGKKLSLGKNIPQTDWKILTGIPTDTILKEMLLESDNFLAEQLILTASSTLSDTLSFSKTKEHIISTYLNDLQEYPRWVDGSGLSRYNLFTPKSMVQVLDKLLRETDSTRLFHLIPKWNAQGTIDPDDPLFEDAFIHAKSGSMGNMYNLCGYLKTKSGKLLLFSFMNNHFRRPSSEVRQNIYSILKAIHQQY